MCHIAVFWPLNATEGGLGAWKSRQKNSYVFEGEDGEKINNMQQDQIRKFLNKPFNGIIWDVKTSTNKDI